MLEINPGLVVWTTVTFIVLLLVLKKFAWKPLIGALQDRENHIKESIEKAEHANHEAVRILEDHKKQIAGAEDEARRILKESRELAEKLKSEIVEKAQLQSRTMIDHAKQEIERDKDAALQQLRNEVAELAVLAAGKILTETLDVNKHRKLVDDVLKTFPKN